jgi:hypothetical protein
MLYPKQSKYIFIDESGDLGPKGSDYFTIAAISTTEPIKIERIIHKTRQRFLKKKKNEINEFKANREKPEVRKYILTQLSNQDCEIYVITIPILKVREYLFKKKSKLYNYLCGLLFERIKLPEKDLYVTIDKKENNSLLQLDFNTYLETKLRTRKYNLNHIEINHMDSVASRSLQVVDFVAWSANRKFTYDEGEYYKIIEKKIVNLGQEIPWK